MQRQHVDQIIVHQVIRVLILQMVILAMHVRQVMLDVVEALVVAVQIAYVVGHAVKECLLVISLVLIQHVVLSIIHVKTLLVGLLHGDHAVIHLMVVKEVMIVQLLKIIIDHIIVILQEQLMYLVMDH